MMTIKDLFSSLKQNHKIEFLDNIFGKCDNKNKNKIKFWGSMIAQRDEYDQTNDYFDNLLYVVNDLNSRLPHPITTPSKSIESLRKVFWKWKNEVKQASQKPKSIADLDLDFPSMKDFDQSLETCLASEEPYEISILVDEQQFIVQITSFQAYLLFKVTDIIK
jgi:hypothetical protein